MGTGSRARPSSTPAGAWPRTRPPKSAGDLAQLGAVASDQADSEALDRAVALIRAGRKVPAQTRVAAMRAARDRGVPISSAELLAAGRG
jgi:hypothetical protein